MTQPVNEPAKAEPPSTSPPTDKNQDLAFRVSVWTMIVVLIVRSPANLLILGWFTETYRDTAASSEVSHRLHEVAFGIFFSLALVGAISQIASVKRNLAGLAQLIITLVTLAVVVTVSLDFDYWLSLFLVPLAGVVAFHGPTRPIREGPVQIWAVFLTVLATPAFASEVANHFARAAQNAQNHTTHWSVMAAFYIVLLLLAVVVASRIRGFKLVGWSLGVAAAVFGVASFAFPYDASSHRREFAVFLVLWGLGWIVGTILAGTSRLKSARMRTLKLVATVAAVPVLLVVSVAIVLADTPPNVPHRPNPDIPEMTAGDVNRATCLDCHGTGTAGAPLVPHDRNQICATYEGCWGGRSDCAGCHRIDPALGGPTDQVFLGLPKIYVHFKQVTSSEELAADAIATLSRLGQEP